MNRLLSRRDKDGPSHRREKSRDKSSDRKLRSFQSVSSISEAFSNSMGKAQPLIQTSRISIQTTTADSRPWFHLQTRPLSGDGLVSLFKTDPQKKIDKEIAKENATKVAAVKQKLSSRGLTTSEGFPNIGEEHINFALGSKDADGDIDRAVELLVLYQQSLEGNIKPYKPEVYLRGAVNRNKRTCWLDSLLFAMFCRLEFFEPLILADFDSEPKRRLAALLRLYVNMLRSGRLIHIDMTERLQDALKDCGWEAGAQDEQQDVSEAFNQISGILEFPMLTLKVDLYHTGKDDDPDDHKIIQERLLDVAVPDDLPEGRTTVRLEDCLETYFNNRVEVKRHLERSITNSSIKPALGMNDELGEESGGPHVEIAELSSPNTPISIVSPIFPQLQRGGLERSTSIIRTMVIPEDEEEVSTIATKTTTETATWENVATSASSATDVESHSTDRPAPMRKFSTRKEVMIPAWQFFNLIPWNTRNPALSDAAVAAHFKDSKPVLGICLKRYDMKDGVPIRKNTLIDIPLDIRLPHFIDEDAEGSEGTPLRGEFKLSLQSVICHQGASTNSGHYISYIRGHSPIVDGDARSKRKLSNATEPPHYAEETWIRCNDLAAPRVAVVDIEEALQKEMPYLLFYQVQAYETITPPSGLEIDPPSYNDSTLAVNVTESTPLDNQPGYFDGAGDESPPSVRVSSEVERSATPRRSLNLPEDRSDYRRGSLAFTDNSIPSTAGSIAATSVPVTPVEETTAQRLSRAASRVTRFPGRSRPSSQGGENKTESRISSTIQRLGMMKSKEQLTKPDGLREFTPVSEPVAEPRKSITIEDPKGDQQPEMRSPLTEISTGINHSKTRKEKKRDRSKGPSESIDSTHPHSLHKGKGKEKHSAKDVPDRECILM